MKSSCGDNHSQVEDAQEKTSKDKPIICKLTEVSIAVLWKVGDNQESEIKKTKLREFKKTGQEYQIQ